MLPSPLTDIKAFVPAYDLEVSKAFYTDLGFTINGSNDEIAELQISCCRFRCRSFSSPGMRQFYDGPERRRCGRLVGVHREKGVS